jgi:hypothetical protein
MGAVGDGFWHTDGALIKDAAGNVVRFSGVNWHGMDSTNLIPHGLWGQSNPANVFTIERHLDEMKANGFNLIRLPFSSEIFNPGQKPQAVSKRLLLNCIPQCSAYFLTYDYNYQHVMAPLRGAHERPTAASWAIQSCF